MKLSLLASAAVTAVVIAAAPASAVVYTTNLGTITVPPSVFLSPGVSVAAGSVTSLYEFVLNSSLTMNASSFTSSAPNPVSFSSVTLYSGTGTSGTPLNTSVTQSSFQGSNFIGLSPVVLTSGSYTIAVQGTASAASSIGSSISFTAPVPEVATWGMMVLGFGVVGTALRSNRRKVAFA